MTQPPAPDYQPNPPARQALPPVVWQGQMRPAFWTTASILSLIVNIILIIIVLVLATQVFNLKRLVGDQLIGGLYGNFVKMDKASIRTTIEVNDTIIVKDTMPVIFDLPLQQKTKVTLTRDNTLKNGKVMLNGVWITTDIILPKGTALDIYLDMVVPVNQTIPVELKVPVSLKVPVDIPLDQTELHEPFVGLQQVLAPYKQIMDKLPNSFNQLCPSWLCGTGAP